MTTNQSLLQRDELAVEGALGVVTEGQHGAHAVLRHLRCKESAQVVVVREDQLFTVQLLAQKGDHVIALDPILCRYGSADLVQGIAHPLLHQVELLIGLRRPAVPAGFVARAQGLAAGLGVLTLQDQDHVVGWDAVGLHHRSEEVNGLVIAILCRVHVHSAAVMLHLDTELGVLALQQICPAQAGHIDNQSFEH